MNILWKRPLGPVLLLPQPHAQEVATSTGKLSKGNNTHSGGNVTHDNAYLANITGITLLVIYITVQYITL